MAQITQKGFDYLRQDWIDIHNLARQRVLFSSPAWSELWWNHFAGADTLCLSSVIDNSITIGIAPLRIRENTAYLIGSDDVCDFLDFIVKPGYEESFFITLLEHLRNMGLNGLNLSPLLTESTAITYLKPIAISRGLEVTCAQEDVTIYLDLPSEQTHYLALLNGKQRHELLRKERRLQEEGEVKFTSHIAPAEEYTGTFLNFFRDSREDKREFLTAARESFFQSIFDNAAFEGILKLGILELNSQPIAATLCFDYRNEAYLYNSGYNPAYKLLSAGLISKYYCIKDSIENGKTRFDFLKGAEKYKYHLGGKEQPVYRCIIKC